MITNYDLYDLSHKLNIPLIGIFSKDKLPYKRDRRDGAYIINLEDDLDVNGNPNQGTHWTCFYIENKQATYFDPFGVVPPRQVQEFLSDYKPISYSTKHIQNVASSVCGWYCLYFLYWISRQKKIKSLAKRLEIFCMKFDENPEKNKRILEKYLRPL